MRPLFLLAAALVLLGCSSDSTPVESVPDRSDPETVAGRWLSAVSDGDAESATMEMEPQGLAIIAAVESNLRSEELVALLRDGLTPELRSSYWSEFAADFVSFGGVSIADLEIRGAAAVPGFPTHSAVTLRAPDADGILMLRDTEDGWRVDFSASVGPALVGPLGEYLATALSGDHAEEIAAAYRTAVVPGLEAAMALQPDNNRLVFEVEYIRQLSAGSAGDTP